MSQDLLELETTLQETEGMLLIDPTNEELLAIKAQLVSAIAELKAALGLTTTSSTTPPSATIPTSNGSSTTGNAAITSLPTATPSLATIAVPSTKTDQSVKVVNIPLMQGEETKWPPGTRVIARWSEDDNWYLARVDSVDTSSTNPVYSVTYLQYGNLGTVTAEDIKQFLPPTGSQLGAGQAIFAMHPNDGMFYEAMIESPSSAVLGAAASLPHGGAGYYRVKFRQNRQRLDVHYNNIYIPPEFSGKILPVSASSAMQALEDPLNHKLVLPDSLKILDSDSEAERKLKQMRAKSMKKAYNLKVCLLLYIYIFILIIIVCTLCLSICSILLLLFSYISDILT